MPQGSGFLNTAPSPIPGGYGNPAGANMGLPSAQAWNSLPTSGAMPTSFTPQAAGSGLPGSFFPANGVTPGAGGGGGGVSVPGGLGGLSSGFSTNDPGRTKDLYNWLGKAYGKGPGQLLGNLLTQGMFNPQVAQAIMNAMEPSIQRGANDVLNAFGDAGARFSSASSIGLGDYMSQARLGQTAQLANMFLSDQQMQLSLLENVLPSIQKERANSGGLFSKILGGLEIAGGAIAAPFSGGASLGLLGAGINTLAGSGGSGGGPGGSLTGALSQLFQPQQMAFPGMSAGGISAAYGGPGQAPLTSSTLGDLLMSQSAGETLGMPASSGIATGMLGF